MKVFCIVMALAALCGLEMDKQRLQSSSLRPATTEVATDFECMAAGEQGAVLCWLMDAREICIEGVDGDYAVVDTGFDDFGAASIGHTSVPCISEVASSLRLTFDPAVVGWQMNAARDSQGALRVVCWTNPDAEGDESRGIVFEPQPGADRMPVGAHTTPGVAVCDVQAIIDNILIY